MQTEPNTTSTTTLTGTLLQRLSTEVRHSLHHVLGTLERILEDPLTREQILQLEHCRSGLHELLRVANDISNLTDYGTVGESAKSFELSQMLEDFSGLIRAQAERKGLDLRWSIDRKVPGALFGHPHVIEAVLYRLVDNSIKYSHRGRIEITATLRPADPATTEVVLEVRDSGPGIAPEILAELKMPPEEQRHIGLGLRVAQKHLATIGGRIEVLPGEGAGATLGIVFPFVAGKPVSDPDNPGTTSEWRHLRLLVAEDSDDSFAVFQEFVANEKHQIVRASDGQQAVDLFKRDTFDLVVMDVNMPVMDGYTATRAIRDWETQQGLTRIPVLLLSADSPARQMRLGWSAGCSGYLTKPTPKRELIYALRHFAGHQPGMMN